MLSNLFRYSNGLFDTLTGTPCRLAFSVRHGVRLPWPAPAPPGRICAWLDRLIFRYVTHIRPLVDAPILRYA